MNNLNCILRKIHEMWVRITWCSGVNMIIYMHVLRKFPQLLNINATAWVREDLRDQGKILQWSNFSNMPVFGRHCRLRNILQLESTHSELIYMVPTELHTQIAIIIGKHLDQQDLACLQTQRCLADKRVYCDKIKHMYLDMFFCMYTLDTHMRQVLSSSRMQK